MTVTIPDSIAEQISDEELRLEVAIIFYEKGKISMGKAAQLAQIPRFEFQHEIAKRKLFVDFDESDLLEDLENIKKLRENS